MSLIFQVYRLCCHEAVAISLLSTTVYWACLEIPLFLSLPVSSPFVNLFFFLHFSSPMRATWCDQRIGSLKGILVPSCHLSCFPFNLPGIESIIHSFFCLWNLFVMNQLVRIVFYGRYLYTTLGFIHYLRRPAWPSPMYIREPPAYKIATNSYHRAQCLETDQ